MSTISGYLSEIKKIKKTGAATELSYRPAIQRLLEAAAKDINVAGLQVLHEPQRQAGNAPDFRIDAGGIIGYVECKKPGEDLDAHTRGRQVERYHALSSNIVLTDGFVWLLLRDKKVIQTAHLGSGSDDALTDLLGIFFCAQPQQIDNASQLAAALAARCNTLREELAVKVGADTKHLRNLYNDLKALIYRDMREDEFADALAQMTVYTLLIAKLRAPAQESLNLYTVQQYIPQSFPLIRELSGFIRHLDDLLYQDIQWTIKDVLACIKNINVADIIETMSGAQTAGVENEDDPFMYFYENFLAAYNPALRKSRGVYYTPLPVVRFIVRAVDDLLKEQLGIASGLAEKRVTTLDFAAGTGTFMVETMRQVLNGKGKAAQMAMIKEHLLKNCHGFELLIAPYAIAHLKLAQYLKNQNYQFDKDNEDQRLKIYLTNTLEKMSQQGEMSFVPALSEEIKQSNAVKNQPILVIMGNPPYSGHSQTASSVVEIRQHKKIKGRMVKDIKDTFIGNLLKEYYQINGQPLGEKNTKWLQDDYVKFFRFAQWKMENVERGIVAIITNHSFLDNPTFRGMRHSLMQAFHRLYFLDLHGNASKKEKTPAGDKDENVFDIKQGVAISLLIKDKNLSRGVFHADVYGRRKDKYDLCSGSSLKEIQWRELKPAALGYFFIPRNEQAEKEYEKYSGINNIFITTSVGIVTARDKLTIAYSEAEIRQRVKAFAGMPVEQARQHFALGADARDWGVERAQKDVRESGCDAKYILPIAYRPFDIRRTYYTGQDRGFLCRPRSTLMSNMTRENIGLITVRQVAEGDFNHVFVTDCIMESRMTLSNKGMAYLYPLYLYQKTMEGLTKGENINPDFRHWINNHYGKKPPAEKIMAYIYAVLHSPQYRKKYADFLRLDFPRIPFVKEWNEFNSLAAIGEKLIAAHLLKNDKTVVEFQGGNAQIDRVNYDEIKHRLYVNRDSYFNGIKPEVYNFLIGGYQPLDKYLKSRKGGNLSLQDMETIAKAAAAISDTLKHIQKIKNYDDIFNFVVK